LPRQAKANKNTKSRWPEVGEEAGGGGFPKKTHATGGLPVGGEGQQKRRRVQSKKKRRKGEPGKREGKKVGRERVIREELGGMNTLKIGVKKKTR